MIYKKTWLLLISLLFNGYKAASTHDSEFVVSTIRQINFRFSTDTNVFFDFDKVFQSEHLRELIIPQLIIAKSVDFRFIKVMDKNMLVVAFISPRKIVEVTAALSKVLYRMHEVNVLFILIDFRDPFPIFDWAWTNGFKNSVAVYWTEGGPQLSEFHPFPQLVVVNIANVHMSNLQKPILNFYGTSIRVTLSEDPVRAFTYTDRHGKLIYSGILFKMLNLFVQHYNASIEEVILPAPYPKVTDYNDYIKAVKEKRIDIGTIPIHCLEEEFICPNVFALFGIYLVVPFAKPVDQNFYFILPFDNWTWFAVIITIFLFAVPISLLEHLTQRHSEFGMAVLQALQGVMYISIKFQINKLRSSIFLFVLLVLTGIILSNLYLAHLSTFLTTLVFEKQINTYNDVVNSKYPIAIAPYEYKLYKSIGVRQDILDKVRFVDTKTWFQQRRDLNTSVIDIVSDEKVAFYAYQQKYLRRPLVKVLNDPLAVLAPAFPMHFTSPYANIYADFVSKSQNTGLCRKFMDELKDDGIAAGMIAFIKPNDSKSMRLSLGHFKIGWTIVGAGYALSTSCFMVEVLWNKTKLRSASSARSSRS